MKVIVPVLLFFVLIITLSSAIQTFPQNSEAKICRAVRDGGALPTSATCNLTVDYSNGSKLIDFQPMQDLTDQFCFNLTSSHTSVKGIYEYQISCTDGVDNATIDSQYLVNLGGIEPSQERTDALSRTIWTFFGFAFLFFLGVLFVKTIPVRTTLFLLMFWFILMGVNASYISIQDEVVNTNIENFFSFFLTISFLFNYVIFIAIVIIWMITFIVNLLDKHRRKLEKDYD